MVTTSYDQPWTSSITRAAICAAVISRHDLNSRGCAAPVTRHFTCEPPTSITSTRRAERADDREIGSTAGSCVICMPPHNTGNLAARWLPGRPHAAPKYSGGETRNIRRPVREKLKAIYIRIMLVGTQALRQ